MLDRILDRILGKEIAFYIKAHRGLVFVSLLLTAVASILTLFPILLVKPFIDEAMKAGSDPATWKILWPEFQSSWPMVHLTETVLVDETSPTRLLILLSLIAIMAVLFRSICLYLSQLAAAAFSNRAIRSLRTDLFEKFISLSLEYYHKQKAGELISRATADLTVMQATIANILIGLVLHPLTAFVVLMYLLFDNWKLTMLAFFIAPVIIGLIRLFGRKAKKHATRVQDATSLVTSAYQESLLCLKVIQGFSMGRRASLKFSVLADQLYKKVMHYNRWFLAQGPMMDPTATFAILVVIIVGKTFFQPTLGELMAMFLAFQKLYTPVRNLARVNAELRTIQGATERVFGIMETIPEIKDRPEAKTLPRHQESIEFREISFSYEPNMPVLDNLSFKVEKGEMVAFVGSTGAGKSTLLDLIPRFYDVTEGSVMIDGIDIRDVTLESLREQISIVSQEVLLFHDTIADNIRYGCPEKDMEEVAKAAKAAHAHNFIMEQSQGYDTVVGDRGDLLSGGQRQRIAIARAILTDPSILILDEAASALDAESEELVQKAIEELRGKQTILVVAHRLSTIRKADRIYVLEDGKIMESGTRDELIALNGRFRQLHDMQFRD
jgi:subfamily B ATP-binding cassette protein MsbA